MSNQTGETFVEEFLIQVMTFFEDFGLVFFGEGVEDMDDVAAVDVDLVSLDHDEGSAGELVAGPLF